MMSWFSLTPPSSPVTLPVTLPGVALPSAPVRTVASLAPLCCAMLALGRRSQPVLPQPGSGELRPSPSFWRKRGPWRFNCCSEGSGEPHPSTTQAAGGSHSTCVLPLQDQSREFWGLAGGHPGNHRVGAPAPGVFLWVSSPSESSRELPQTLPEDRDARGLLLQPISRPSRTFFRQHGRDLRSWAGLGCDPWHFPLESKQFSVNHLQPKK